MVLNIDGSNSRRLGMDFESDYDIIATSIAGADGVNVTMTNFRWDNAGGNPEKRIQVVQTGNQLHFFTMGEGAISKGYFHTEIFSASSNTVRFSYAVVDGILVVSNGDKEIYKLEFTEPNVITRTSGRLKIRDFFGVEDMSDGNDITNGDHVQDRPYVLTDNHLYNLRNQTWGISRLNANDEAPIDPIFSFRSFASGRYPSNADNVIASLYNDAQDADNRVIDRFFADDLFKNPLGSFRAPMGYFVIDALDRGTSRLNAVSDNQSRWPGLIFNITTLPQDITPSGATTIAEFAGRAWYAGFPGEVVDGDSKSPRMSSYVLFSKVVNTADDITNCYQEGDPTSKEAPDVIATDGGFIRLNGAYGIKALINLGSSLMVVAANGVWRIVGGSDAGFTATAYIVEKITDRGCTSFESIAVIDSSFMFWADDAIYHVHTDQFGGWICDNISFGRIQRFYDNINIESKRNAKGAYDSYERKVRWLYNNYTTNVEEVKELVLDIQLKAYYPNTIKAFNDTQFPKTASMYLGVPYQVSETNIDIIAGVEPVLVGVEEVVVSSEERLGTSQRELGYLIITQVIPTLSFTFGKYTNTDFRDWASMNGTGVDAEAFTVTSYMSGGDFQRNKGVMYITTHMRRTETGYDADLVPLNQSSCLVQARWGWSNSDNSGKWGREFQCYRYRRLYLPVDVDDQLDNGFSTVVSRNKLRGSGRVLSLRFRSEPYRNLHLYGWSMIFSTAENV